MTQEYIEEVKKALEKIELEKIKRISEVLERAYKNDKSVFIIGNGGSATTASHFACDLGKGTLAQNTILGFIKTLSEGFRFLNELESSTACFTDPFPS